MGNWWKTERGPKGDNVFFLVLITKSNDCIIYAWWYHQTCIIRGELWGRLQRQMFSSSYCWVMKLHNFCICKTNIADDNVKFKSQTWIGDRNKQRSTILTLKPWQESRILRCQNSPRFFYKYCASFEETEQSHKCQENHISSSQSSLLLILLMQEGQYCD